MKKAILINLDLLKSNEYKDVKYLEVIKNNLIHLAEEGENAICFYSRDNKVINGAKKYYQDKHPDVKFIFKTRIELEKIIEKHKDDRHHYVFVGKKDADFFMAIKYKLLLIVPTWMNTEEKAEKYGVKVDNIKQLIMFINALNNQNYWYSKIKVDEITTVYSLMDARYGCYAKSNKEKEMVQNFQNLLKKGASRSYYDILLYHFLSAITNIKSFDDITIWGIIPSSNCSLNQDMLNFKEQVRYIKKGDQKNIAYNNVLVRHTEKNKAQGAGYERSTYGSVKEFNTVMINPEFKTKIDKLLEKNELNVCIFDDYLTHGNSFDSVRNLFERLGANKIICVSLGSFCTCYEKNNYEINGDVFSNAYTYSHIEHAPISSSDFEINNSAKDEIESLYYIFNK